MITENSPQLDWVFAACSNICITIHTFTSAVKSPTNVLFQLANKHRSLPDVPLHSSSLLSFPFLLTSQLNFFCWNSDLSGKFDRTANEHYTPTCLLPWKHPLNSFRGPLQDVPTRSAGWHCVSASEGKKMGGKTTTHHPQSQVWEPKWTRCTQIPPTPIFHRKKIEMIPRCAHQLLFVRPDEKLLPARIYFGLSFLIFLQSLYKVGVPYLPDWKEKL